MRKKIRILIADDSTVVRRLLSEVLGREPRIEVVGIASNGTEVVQLFSRVQPDVVLLDVELPDMDGVQAVDEIRKIHRTVPIVMLSSLTIKGGEATLDALNRGASDCVAKPPRVGHLNEAAAYVRENLTPKIVAWGSSLKPPTRRARVLARPTSRPGQVEVVAVGVSTGGPKALADLLSSIPVDFPVPIVVVQHMPPLLTQLLADRLDQVCPLRVREAVHDARLRRGDVWVAAGDLHLRVARHGPRTRLQLDDSPPEHSCRPAVDVLFRSVARAFQDRCIALVLTGMGKDGLEGSRAIVNAGGRIIAQDEQTSAVWGMPRAVAEAGLAERNLPLHEMAGELCELVYEQTTASSSGG